jgi:hypothetical protein
VNAGQLLRGHEAAVEVHSSTAGVPERAQRVEEAIGQFASFQRDRDTGQPKGGVGLDRLQGIAARQRLPTWRHADDSASGRDGAAARRAVVPKPFALAAAQRQP